MEYFSLREPSKNYPKKEALPQENRQSKVETISLVIYIDVQYFNN